MNPVWFILSIILLPLTTVQAGFSFLDKLELIYKKPGETVVLSLSSMTPPITNITWKFSTDMSEDLTLAAEWNGGEVDFYQDFRGRSTLNTTTGELTISNLTLKDLGGYIIEINNEVMQIKILVVVLPVTKPTISMSCDDEKTHCVLKCEVNTRDLGEVSYSWTLGDMVGWRQSEKIKITKEQKEPSLLCVVKNPVSYEFSDRVVNPFSNNP
ncbi:uncharacterized protein LOC125001028 [Mugil cephalus]|uniref:uncharacterized protein LOC125001028 n=1 Tax=Mugil cephalus TaxID=48193 RepID=UPI001FB7B27E|nr:uncharacterized protein LOC125001028 [Mugil cephalus]